MAEQRLRYKGTDALDVAKPLRRYLTHVYGEAEAAEYLEACHTFAELRESLRAAVSGMHVTLEQLQQYYARLECLAAHFPVSAREGEAKISFVWHDAVASGKCSQANLHLERAGTIYNMAVHYCDLAAKEKQQMLADNAATKQAAHYYGCAAACFATIHTRLQSQLGDPLTTDLSPAALRGLEMMMLAEAQELYLGMAQAKQSSSKALSKLAAGARSLWSDTQRYLTEANLLNKLPGKWAHRIEVRIAWLTAEAETAQADLCMNPPADSGMSLSMGEALARLRIARDSFSKAKACARKHMPTSVQDKIALSESTTLQILADVEKDNQLIYMESVPASVSPVVGYVMAKRNQALPDALAGDFANDADPWASLVSQDEFTAVQSYNKQEAALYAEQVQSLKGATAAVQSQLFEMGLPGMLDSVDTPLGEIPAHLQKKIRKVGFDTLGVGSGGVNGIKILLKDLKSRTAKRREMLTTCENLLTREAADDARCRERHGKNWTEKPSQTKTVKLRQEWAATEQLCAKEEQREAQIAQRLDAGLRERPGRVSLDVISNGPEVAQSKMPGQLGRQTSVDKRATEKITAELRDLLSSLDSLLDSRTQLAVQLDQRREQAASVEGVRSALRGSSHHSREGIVADELAKFEPVLKSIRENIDSESSVLSALRVAHNEFVRMKPPDTELDHQRKQFFEQLSDACTEFHTLLGACQALISDRNAAAKHFERLQPECIRFVEKRATKRSALLQKLTGETNPRVFRPATARSGARTVQHRPQSKQTHRRRRSSIETQGSLSFGDGSGVWWWQAKKRVETVQS